MKEITLITTGRTIDGADSDKGTLRHASEAAKWLQMQTNLTFSHIELMNKDSRLLTDDDRNSIIEAVYGALSEHVLVTHGTFTICETGRAILKAANLNNISKVVLLVGSWKPFGEDNSDAPKQMKFALRSFQAAQSGVFIAMDGRLWSPAMTRKIEVEPGVYQLCEAVI
jgi:L-asparaginase